MSEERWEIRLKPINVSVLWIKVVITSLVTYLHSFTFCEIYQFLFFDWLSQMTQNTIKLFLKQNVFVQVIFSSVARYVAGDV